MALNFLAQNGQTTDTVIFDSVIDLMAQFGFFKVIIPFLLVFAITYGMLLKTRVLGDPEDSTTKSISAIIAMSLAFFVISSRATVNALSLLLPQASFLLVILLFLILTFAFVGFKTGPDSLSGASKWTYLIIALVLIIFLGIIDSATEFQIPVIHSLAGFFLGTSGTGAGLSAGSITTIIGAVVFLIMIGMIIYLVRGSD